MPTVDYSGDSSPAFQVELRSAKRKVQSGLLDWVYKPDRRFKPQMAKRWEALHSFEREAYAKYIRDTFWNEFGDDPVVVYRVMRSGDDPDQMGMASVTTDPTRGPTMAAFEIDHTDVLAHYGEPGSPLSSRRYGSEKEIILRPDAKPYVLRKNPSPSKQAAQSRWLTFSNGLMASKQFPWATKGKKEVSLKWSWPKQWDYAGIAREIRYTSDKMLPDKDNDSTVSYKHDFNKSPSGPNVHLYMPKGMIDFGDPVSEEQIRRRSMSDGKPRWPRSLAFLAECEGWSVCPPGTSPRCKLESAFEGFCDNSVLATSPEGDMLVVLDGDNGWRPSAVFVGDTLSVEEEGIDD